MSIAWRDPLLFHPRVAGRRWRGALLAAVGVLLLIAAVFGAAQAAADGTATVLWATLSAASLVAGAVATALGIDEFRRPVRIDRAGRAHDPSVESAALRWHPKHAEIVDEFRHTTQLHGAASATIGAGFMTIGSAGGMIGSAIDEAASGTLRTRLVFDGAPFRVGDKARMSFHASPTRGDVRECRATFHLRCLRERPEDATEILSKVECVANLVPIRSTREIRRRTISFTMEFDLAAGLPGADLLARRPVYWELTVEIAGLKGPYVERFFVPVAT